MSRIAKALPALGMIAVLGGCEVGPNYHRPESDLPPSFAASDGQAQKNGDVRGDEERWWESFHDAELNALVTQAIAANLDLKIAMARLQEARTEEAVALGEALPAAGLSGAAGRGTGSDLTRGRLAPPLQSADNRDGAKVKQAVGFDAGLELDLFGGLRREIEAAGDDAQAAEAARNDTIVALIADVVRSYFDLRGLQMRRGVLDRSIDTARQTVNFVGARYDRGLTNELDVTLAQRELSALAAEAAPLGGQIAAARFQIATLLGHYPEELGHELDQPGTIPALPETVATGAPIDLLRRRPDIREAERELAAATARIGVAAANLYPHLDITGAAGWQGPSGAEGNPFIWAVGPAAQWSLLDFGALDALVDIADLRTREFLLTYRGTILQAVRQVDTATATYGAAQESLCDIGDALTAGQRSVTLASERYDRGLTDFLNVLDAERQEYQLEDQYASTDQAAADALVNVYQGLGGGWESFQSIPEAPRPQPAVVAAFERLFSGETHTGVSAPAENQSKS